MRLGELRQQFKIYEQTWYFRKFVYGNHDEATAIKNFLDNLSSQPDEYNFSHEETLKILQTISSNSKLNLIHQIRNFFKQTEFELFRRLNDLELANLSNFIRISQLPVSNDDEIYHLISNPEMHHILKSADGSLRQDILDTLLKTYEYKIDFPPSKDAIINCFKILDKNQILNVSTLNCLFEQRDNLNPLYKIINHLSEFNLLTEDLIVRVSKLHYLYKFENILAELSQRNLKTIDKNVLELLILNSDSIYEFSELVSLLTDGHCLNKSNLEIFIEQKNKFNFGLLPTLKMIQAEKLLNDDTFKFISTSVQCNKDYQFCLSILSKYNLIDEEFIYQLTNENVASLFNILNYLSIQNLVTDTTVRTTVQLFLQDKIDDLSMILLGLSKTGTVITENDFNMLCQTTRQSKLTELLTRLSSDAQVQTNNNLHALLILSDPQFEYLFKFITSNYFILTQEAFDEILEVTTTVIPNCKQDQEVSNQSKHHPLPSSGDNQEAIDSLIKNFYLYSQNIIDDFYLQPLSKDNAGFTLASKVKSNLKDGTVEREIHGAMHAARAQFYTKILHSKFKEMFPEYMQETMLYLTKTLKLSEEQLLYLIRYTTLFHDSARENESTDFWEQQSAQNCFKFLTAKGVSPGLSELLMMAAAYKDSPGVYETYLKNKNFEQDKFQFFHYIRKLIFMSDCLDIMRCVGEFNFSKILSAVEDINGYQEGEHSQTMLELVKQIHQLIRDQHDMLFACKIILPDSGNIQLNNKTSCFDLRKKTEFEHAENACSAIGQSFKEHSWFATYFENEAFLSTKKADNIRAFNPYVHGTNSLIFSTLERTNQTILSPVEMLENYGIAPVGGEITGGGLNTATARCNTCFGRMNSKGVNDYTLPKIINGYTNFRMNSPEDTRSNAKRYAENSLKSAFSNVNIMLIYLARSKQQGFDAISKEDAEELMQKLNATIQFFYLLILLGKKIYPNFTLLSSYNKETRLDFAGAVYTHLTFENLVNKIMSSNLNIKEIYDHPTPENLRKVLAILEIPKEGIIETSLLRNKPKKVNLSESQLFTLEQQRSSGNKMIDVDETDDYFYSIAKNDSYKGINLLLNKFLGDLFTAEFFEELEKKALSHVEVLCRKADVLKKIVTSNSEVMKYSDRQQFFLKHPFPILLICESEDKISLFSFQSQEYRANEPLKLGQDIKVIATDTEEHRLFIMKYLEENKIYNTSVILFHQLLISQLNSKQPQSKYCHKDGFPKLSWLAAKKVPDNVESKDKTTSEKIAAAQKYKSIQFR